MVSCGSSEDNAYHGYLYFAQGSYLMRFSLHDGSLSVVTNLGNKKIQEISQLGEGRLLISELASINRKNVAGISWLDLKTGRSESLYSGYQARFVSGAGVIVYDDGTKLYSVPLAGDSEIDTIILSYKRHQLTAMVEVSDDRLLFETRKEDQPVIYVYQAVSGELQSLDQLTGLCRLEGAVWIGDLGQLACRKRGGESDEAAGAYVLADLDGNLMASLLLPEGEKFLALAYINEQGALIFKESWFRQFGGQEKSAVWAHDIHTGENRRLSGTQNLGPSVVYTDY